MSDERRKRQQERQESKPSKEDRLFSYIAVIGVLIALTGGLYYRYSKNHKYDSFAKCVASKNAKMYGLFWCSHCADQKREFASSFRYVPYVECAGENDPMHELTPACKAAGLKQFPSWQFGDQPPKAGVLSLEAISHETGCSLP